MTMLVYNFSATVSIRNKCMTAFHKSVKDWLVDNELAEDLVDLMAGHSGCMQSLDSIGLVAPRVFNL